jgi:hypothetical protein
MQAAALKLRNTTLSGLSFAIIRPCMHLALNWQKGIKGEMAASRNNEIGAES